MNVARVGWGGGAAEDGRFTKTGKSLIIRRTSSFARSVVYSFIYIFYFIFFLGGGGRCGVAMVWGWVVGEQTAGWNLGTMSTGPRSYKLLIFLNSTEHDIYNTQ